MNGSKGDNDLIHLHGSFSLNVCLTLPAGMILVPYIDLNLILEVIRNYKPALFPGVPDIYMALMCIEAEKYNELNPGLHQRRFADAPGGARTFRRKPAAVFEAYGLASI